MEQRDYLEREIEQLGRLLGKILSDLGRLHGKGKVSGTIAEAEQSLQGELDIELDKILVLPDEDFVGLLLTKRGFNNTNLEKLSNILLLLAEEKRGAEKENMLRKCLAILEHLQTAGGVYSLEKASTITGIRRML
ncbi:MAG: hypothetical protein J5I50_08495 [Chitinophagaceae bacterium]|nr:hypothetical protein [Chitinophagaceae bacterium]